ncbi:FAS1 domain-containing protein [Amylocystis lapponica]|nr:FAS1 domain-containing protein [Amylocystis lapponica]
MLLRTIVATLFAVFAVSALQDQSTIEREDDSEGDLLTSDQWRVGVDVDGMRPPKLPGHPPIPHKPKPDHPKKPLPPKEHHHIRVDNKTIYQVLKDEPRFSLAFKLVNYTEEITNLLNDSSANVTFFAPPNWAFRRPKHTKHHHHPKGPHKHASLDDELVHFDEEVHCTGISMSLSGSLDFFGAVENVLQGDCIRNESDSPAQHDIAAIIRRVLLYHILPTNVSSLELARNATHPTSLALDGALDGEVLRIGVKSGPGLLKPHLLLNHRVKVVVSDIKALNGVIHVINHPLLPPRSIFEKLFAAPKKFSVLTSALGRVDLIDALDLHHVPESEDTKGSPAVTFFAPTNHAFERLPKRLQHFLFSRHGERALKKLLQFHTLPEFVLYSDWTHNASSAESAANKFVVVGDHASDLDEDTSTLLDLLADDADLAHNMPPLPWPPSLPVDWRPHPANPKDHHLPHPHPVFALNITVPTLLTNFSLTVRVAQFERLLPRHTFFTKLAANGQPVAVSDVVASNGALHVIDTFLNPFKEHHRPGTPRKPKHGEGVNVDAAEEDEDEDEDEWEDWEEWLPAWADQE